MDSEVFQRLQLIKPVKEVLSFKDVKNVQLESGFQLPISYCDFAATFGFGILCDFFYIFIPDHKVENLKDRSKQLKEVINESLEDEIIDEFYDEATPELVSRLIPFAISKNGDTLAWNPDELVISNENVIYTLSPKMLGVRRGADTLYEFIESCLDERIKKMMGLSFEPLPPTFEPIFQSE